MPREAKPATNAVPDMRDRSIGMEFAHPPFINDVYERLMFPIAFVATYGTYNQEDSTMLGRYVERVSRPMTASTNPRVISPIDEYRHAKFASRVLSTYTPYESYGDMISSPAIGYGMCVERYAVRHMDQSARRIKRTHVSILAPKVAKVDPNKRNRKIKRDKPTRAQVPKDIRGGGIRAGKFKAKFR
ncbi:nudix hydrolase domain protein [Faustovirus]|nr:nudix hydrolase domain protein [Faustovirus]QJX73473.1 hypothetical protein F-VV63_0207 [Faustovirus]